MKHKLIIAIVPALLLAGCDDPAGFEKQKSPGRYAGNGVFDAGQLWGRMKGVPEPSDPDAATIADDEHIIVVIDSHTGAVRQCGDHSGYCVAMNPWSGEARPVKLEVHANQLGEEVVEGPVAEAAAEPAAAGR